MKFSVLPVSPHELPSLVKINRVDEFGTQTAQYSDFDLFQWWGDIDLLNWHYDLIKRCSGDILVAKAGSGEIIGELDFVIEQKFSPKRIHLFWLYVHPSYRRKGVGEMMLNYLSKIANEERLRIWVEAEDTRSERLYQKKGTVVTTLRNYTIDFVSPSPAVHNLLSNIELLSPSISYSFENFDISHHTRIIGQYNIPTFDLLQLTESIGTVAEQYIWGETLPPILLSYSFPETEIKVILTQYLRMYVSSPPSESTLKKIMQDVVCRAFNEGFVGLNIQVYGNYMGSLFSSLGFVEEESNDPIFCI